MVSNVNANHQNYFGRRDDEFLLSKYNFPKYIDLEKYYSGTKLIKYRDDTINSQELFSGYVPETNITVNNNSTRYIMPPQLIKHKGNMIKMRHLIYEHNTGNELQMWNGNIVGVKNLKVITSDNNIFLDLNTQMINYYDIVSTEFAMDIGIKEHNKTIRDMSLPRPELPTLDATQLPNHIGVDGLIITRDLCLIIQVRSDKTALNNGMRYSSVAGNMKDNGNMSLYGAFRREAREELGITKFRSLKLIGGARILHTGGSVSFCFVGWIQETKNELLQRLRESRPIDAWEYGNLEFVRYPGSMNKLSEKLYEVSLDNGQDDIQNLLLTSYFFDKYVEDGKKRPLN